MSEHVIVAELVGGTVVARDGAPSRFVPSREAITAGQLLTAKPTGGSRQVYVSARLAAPDPEAGQQVAKEIVGQLVNAAVSSR